jgi:hypothetical protein
MNGAKECYVLMLVYVDDDWMDIGGNIYPKEGYIEAANFTNDVDIRFGLYGIPWGKTNYLQYEKIDSGHWIVVKTDLSEDLIKTDHFRNRYKFNKGFVVYEGSLRSAARFIIKHKDESGFVDEAESILPEEVFGSTPWRKEHDFKE